MSTPTTREISQAIDELESVGANYREGGPWRLFLDLIGYENDEDAIGYLEAGTLGRALAAWARNPLQVRSYIENWKEREE